MKSSKLDIKIIETEKEFIIFLTHKNASSMDVDIEPIKKALVIVHSESKVEIRIKKKDFGFLTNELIYKAFSITEKTIY